MIIPIRTYKKFWIYFHLINLHVWSLIILLFHVANFFMLPIPFRSELILGLLGTINNPFVLFFYGKNKQNRANKKKKQQKIVNYKLFRDKDIIFANKLSNWTGNETQL